MKRGLKHILLWLALAALLALLTGAALAETYEHNYHYENCTSRGVCAIGGEPYMGNLRHSIDCGNLGVCQFCGEKVVATVDTHRGPFRWEFDRQKHWQVCLNCGEECFFMEHYVGCRTPGVCMDCGGPTDEPVRYHGDFNQATEYDLDHHWVICTVCGDTLEGPFEHVPYSENPSLCGVCGASLKVSLEGADISTNNPLNKLAIYRNGQLVDYTGFAKFDGEDFYFVHGVIDETKTGVVKLLDTWYAFDYGRVMREDMMVPFEGGVFCFYNGTLATGASGVLPFYTAEGSGWFLFSCGMFQPGVNGPWHDAAHGEWYYLVESRWDQNFKDVVDFNGAKFYFVGGRLATWYTGYATGSDGVEYYVEKGQVQEDDGAWG